MTEKFDPGTFEGSGCVELLSRRPLEDGDRVFEAFQGQNAVDPNPDVPAGKLEVVLGGVELDPQRAVGSFLQKHGSDGVVQTSVDVGVDVSNPFGSNIEILCRKKLRTFCPERLEKLVGQANGWKLLWM